ncbi:peptidoglycan DD-metalloendopeptidase family protein [Cellulosilyticum sp. ST5]|uniref:Peptidase M23 n=1 Tax=Cellulosilyticum lentocellum (strain ATCC 49066 / DSM 5427 / NCIMB 11756 / RHM5) TaxID=642492 RepID=F2JSE1_CELLD|nr:MULTISPECIES: M23 family metallopeptidase [Cellulosilyticum]ADZ85179.1 Peptidase M23 [Cellulosilyticum lentocellum DSM 5427]QEH70737.1 peptidoglycan DD-metalloendopeptidase family protein [Cellulosilyticum sp. WCF-2]
MKKQISILLAFTLLLVPVYADTINDKKNQLSSAEQHIKDKEQLLEERKQERAAIEAEIKEVDTKMVAIQDNIKELGDQLEQKKLEIEESEKELEAANIKKDEQYEATKARMVQMYKNQKVGYIQVVFSSNSFWEAINRLEYIRRISEKDNTLLDTYQAQIDYIEVQKEKIESEKSDLDLLQKKEISKKNELEEARAAKQVAIDKLESEEGKLAGEISKLEEISEQLEEDIKKLTEEMEAKNKNQIPTQYTGGTFTWPVPGYYRISSEYNPRTSPISGNYEFHTGIDIPAGYGEDVVAAGDGVVITAGWINGYGNTVMISHGSGIVTLYGHNSSVVVSQGQTVSKGQVVAKIGSTGYSTGNHCHFEVRVNGSHTSPWPYLN